MSRSRLNIFIEHDQATRLEELAILMRVSKSGIVAAALAAYFSPEAANQRYAAIASRLDALSRHLEHMERDQTVLLETLALWVRHQLAVSTPVPEGLQDAARAQGRARFSDFVAQLARHLQRGGSIVREVWREIAPEEPLYPGTRAGAPTRTNGAGASPTTDGQPT